MSTYQATEPPDGSTCDTRGCRSAAMVRLIIPPSRFEADGADHSQDPPVFGACEQHYPVIAGTAMRNGHTVVDTTGNIRDVMAEFPTWTVFLSDSGRLYASARVNGPQGTTVDAYLVSQLRAQMRALTDGAH